MKKFTLFALAMMTLLPGTTKAESWEKTVTTKAEWDAAVKAIGGVSGETYVITLDGDASTSINTGTWKPTATSGRIIIRSNQTEYDKMPQLLARIDWANDLADNGGNGKNLSLIFENINLQFNGGASASSGQIVYFNKKRAPIDTIAFRNCDINNCPRTIMRSVPVDNAEETDYHKLDVFEMSNCIVHDINTLSSNSWFSVVLGQPVNSMTFKNNVFYDMPYSKGIWQMSRVPVLDAAPTVYFENNTVLVGSNRKVAGNVFQVLAPGDYLGETATYNINNNMFIAPKVGKHSLYNEIDSLSYDGKGMILNSGSGIVMATNNVIDSCGYQGWDADCFNKETGESKWTYQQISGDLTLEDAGITSWEEGVVFQDPANSIYNMLKSSTAAAGNLGSSLLYVDGFPVKANVNISINGPKYIGCTITPVKDVYYVGDELAITLNDHNSYYRTFNKFLGWSNGETEKSITVKLSGDLELTASFEETTDVLAAFDFSAITKNANYATYPADICADGYQAIISGVVVDTLGIGTTYQTAALPYVAGNLQGRPAKFGEDAAEIQMPILSRRTSKYVKANQRDYAVIAFSTESVNSMTFSCFVGSDNNAAKTQAIEYSTDSATWTRLATVDIENGKWSELTAELPAALENKERVYVRIIGDLANGFIYSPDPAGGIVDDNGEFDDEAYLSADAFEYIGNILITGKNISNGIISTKSDMNANTDAPFYNMMGIKVAKGTKGLLIQNGKKILVK
jgi:hypothetical protein